MGIVGGERFEGFSRDAIDFLAELAQHNERAWFEPRKGDYLRLLKEPLAALCVAVDSEFKARALPLTADPARSPYRIYRDVRFSPDKSPYTIHASASFPWRNRGRGFSGFFHFQPGRVLVGGGMWTSDPARVAAWRVMVIERPEDVHEAVESPAFVRTFGRLAGEAVRRLPPGIPGDHPDLELIRLRNWWFECPLSDEEAFSVRLPATIADMLADARPVFELLDRLPEADLAREPAWARP